MAITIKDIHEKEFSRQVRGYSIDEVDDFLDQLATQMEAMIKENREAVAAAEEAKAAAEEAKANVPVVVNQPVQAIQPVQAAPVPAQPIIDDSQYYKNLETTIRETLGSAQRLADETIADARKKANAMIAAAEEQAASITSAARTEADAARAEVDELKQTAEDYRGRFLRLLEEQAHLLKADDSIFTK